MRDKLRNKQRHTLRKCNLPAALHVLSVPERKAGDRDANATPNTVEERKSTNACDALRCQARARGWTLP
eukprot:3046639-Alexandrium_andersonii.AAC.1